MAFTSLEKMFSPDERAMMVRKPHKLARNTYEWYLPNDEVRVRLHHTDILVRHPLRGTMLFAGGWRTVTTKARLNDLLRPNGAAGELGYHIYLQKGEWRVVRGFNFDGGVPFFEGITLPDDIDAPNEWASEHTRKLSTRIAKFARSVPTAELDPQPCELCLMLVDGVRGELPGVGIPHWKEHLRRRPDRAFICLCARAAGYNGAVYESYSPARISRFVRRFLRFKFGLPT